MSTIQDPQDQRLVLHNVSWATYEHLLADFENSSAPRFTYDRGTLEIMSPLPDHERCKHTIELVIDVIAEERDLDVETLGSTTFKREDLERGFEPDSCFYLQHAAQIRGKTRIDLQVDPPPDLVVEIDLTHSSIDKLPIFAQLGVPEVWRYDGRALTILTLDGSTYRLCNESRALPGLTAEVLSGFIEDSKSLTRKAWRAKVREWAREQGHPGTRSGE